MTVTSGGRTTGSVPGLAPVSEVFGDSAGAGSRLASAHASTNPSGFDPFYGTGKRR